VLTRSFGENDAINTNLASSCYPFSFDPPDRT